MTLLQIRKYKYKFIKPIIPLYDLYLRLACPQSIFLTEMNINKENAEKFSMKSFYSPD